MTNKSKGKELFYKLGVRNKKCFELSASAGPKLLDSQQIRKEQYHCLVPNLQKIVISHSFGDLAEQQWKNKSQVTT